MDAHVHIRLHKGRQDLAGKAQIKLPDLSTCRRHYQPRTRSLAIRTDDKYSLSAVTLIRSNIHTPT